jgi:zinc-finger binding domain of transposase IS66
MRWASCCELNRGSTSLSRVREDEDANEQDGAEGSRARRRSRAAGGCPRRGRAGGGGAARVAQHGAAAASREGARAGEEQERAGLAAKASEKLEETAATNGGREELAKPAKQPPVRRPPPPELRRVPNEIAVPAPERPCPRCGGERTCIGHDTTEVIELVPAEIIVRIDRREVLACRACEAEVVRAPLGDEVVEGGA